MINGLQNENNKFDFINDKTLSEILKNECYKVLLQIKQTIVDERLSDEDCFIKIEEIMGVLEENNIFCNRHDFA